jgi:hypothetical protein
MTKAEMIEIIFNAQIESDNDVANAEYQFGGQEPYTIGLRFANVQSREIISKLNLDEAFYQYREEKNI